MLYTPAGERGRSVDFFIAGSMPAGDIAGRFSRVSSSVLIASLTSVVLAEHGGAEPERIPGRGEPERLLPDSVSARESKYACVHIGVPGGSIQRTICALLKWQPQ